MKIYYAHHQWKYDTPLENIEIDNIKNTFKDCEIVNPNGILNVQGRTEKEIMEQCFECIDECDIVVFSTIQYGYIGVGVYQEILHGLKKDKDIYIINEYFATSFTKEDFHNIIIVIDKTKTKRLYAKVVQNNKLKQK